MAADYGYINARVRGLKSKLLGPEFYTEALNATDFRAFTSALSQTAYLREVEEAGAKYSGLRMIDEAIARNLYNTTRGILGFASGKPGRLIGLLLLRYDLHNLKAVARAKHAGRGAEDVLAALMPAGELKPSVLENIAAAPDLPSAAQALAITKHPLASAFSRAVSRYTSEGDLYALELSLDRAYYQVLFEELEKASPPAALKRHFQREVDATNIRTAMKMQGRSMTGDLFIPGGKEVRRDTFEGIVNDSGGGIQTLASSSFSGVAEAKSLTAAEEVIRNSLDKSARALYLSDPLDIGVVLNYLRLKEAETSRLRLLARGKFYGVPRAQLETELGDA